MGKAKSRLTRLIREYRANVIVALLQWFGGSAIFAATGIYIRAFILHLSLDWKLLLTWLALGTLLVIAAVLLYIKKDQPVSVSDAAVIGFKPLTREQQTPTIGRHFTNEVVDIDGKNFMKCHFMNVTLRYNGTTTLSLSDSNFAGIRLVSANPAVEGAWAVAYGLGLMKHPILDQNNRPITNITSPREGKNGEDNASKSLLPERP